MKLLVQAPMRVLGFESILTNLFAPSSTKLVPRPCCPSFKGDKAKLRGHRAHGLQGLRESPALVTRQKIKKAYSTWYSQAVSHPSTNQARPCLASEIGRDRACSGWCGRKRQPQPPMRLMYLPGGAMVEWLSDRESMAWAKGLVVQAVS